MEEKWQISYINIQWFMIYNLWLSWNELLLFALIYWYTQDWKNEYHWSLSYIQNWLQLSRPSVISLLKKLQTKWYIIKTKNSHFIATSKESLLVKKVYQTSKESLLATSKESLPLASKESLPNNNKEIIINNKNKNKYGEYSHIFLTDIEKENLIKDFWNEIFSLYIKKLDEYIEISWKKYKNHFLVIRNWINKDFSKNKNLKVEKNWNEGL